MNIIMLHFNRLHILRKEKSPQIKSDKSNEKSSDFRSQEVIFSFTHVVLT